ncbi:protein-export chaperone SecB [Pontibacillus salipaludis]|uniref:Preprotein translocase subunit SecB n=1 Tax=Pontibacillus salipaludis TaxID=1697394 RepID=A0ABQ1QCH1_9BACI|nr:protein-export chaperone SecB [Pontibacillus salipaludis]GGD22938.1 hypothetical protein GCM10011389_33360 [Pontibacillus salipaludis]
MEESTESALVFRDYFINSFDYKRSEHAHFSDDTAIELSFDLSAHAGMNEEKDSLKLLIGCTIFEEEFSQGNAPFYLEANITGFFDCKGSFDIENFEYNAIAILLPYLRSFITSYTSQAGIAPVILPPINVYNAFRKT